jgi:DNA-binding transcriptional ArsR family regulator
MQPPSTNLDRIFFALADPSRRRMLARLCDGSASIGELAAPLPISAPAVTRHVRVLEQAGLIRRNVHGRVHRCSLTRNGLQTAEEWLRYHRRFWESRLDAIGKLLETAPVATVRKS